MSIEALRSLKAVIDFEHDLVVFRGLDTSRAIQLQRSSTGHQLLSLSKDLYSEALPLKSALGSLKEHLAPNE